MAGGGKGAGAAFSRFHQGADEQPRTEVSTRLAGETSRAETAPGPRLARLTRWACLPAGEERTLSLWWDAIYHQALLTTVVRCRPGIGRASYPMAAMIETKLEISSGVASCFRPISRSEE